MEIRISRILSEYYDYTRKESEEFIRQGRVTCNGKQVVIGDKALVSDIVELDAVKVPLKGIFKKVRLEAADRDREAQFGSFREDRKGKGYSDSFDKRNRSKSNSSKKSFLRQGRVKDLYEEE